MLEFLFKQIPYNFSLKKQILIGAILGSIIVFIMVFLQPFGTYRFESSHKYLIFSGFGLPTLLAYLFCARIENWWYHHKDKRWQIRWEIISFTGFMLISSLPIHFYNQVFLNDLFNHKFQGYEYLKHGLWFFGHSIVPVMLILLPFYLYFRNKFGILVTPETLNEIEFQGLNNGEKLITQKDSLVFVKASENYVKIFYTKEDIVKHATIRNTLKAIKEQAPFLIQCHRSFLVNVTQIKTVKGNSQNASIAFYNGSLSIPLSKSYYKTVKSTLSVKP